MIGVDSSFARCTKWNLIGGGVIDDVEDGQSPVRGLRTADIHERARGLKLTARDRIDHEADLCLEYAARYALEQNFGLVAGTNALQGVLLESGSQSPVSWFVIDENHGWTQGNRDHVHAWPQREFRDKAACGCSNGGLVQIEFSVGKL